MIPASYAHNFYPHKKEAHPLDRTYFYNRDPHHFTGDTGCREEFKPTEILLSMKQQINNMADEQQSTIAQHPEKGDEQQQHHQQRQSNEQLDVAVVQPSFDDHESRSLGLEKKLPDRRDGNSTPSREGHRRNLSEHFEDAARLTQGKLSDTGQKHRREYSADMSNPAKAHRRIDSIGESTSIQRGKPHRRIDSSGLDALTAAADFSREELEAAASQSRHSWNQHSTNFRRSPIETSAHFEPGAHGPGPLPHQGPPHIPSNITHHRHYPPTTSSGGLPRRPIYYSQYPQPPYPHTYHYPHHPGSNGYDRHHGQPLHPPPSAYPVQYARPHGQDPYMKHHAPLQQPTLERPHTDSPARRSPPIVTSIDHKKGTAIDKVGIRPPPPPSTPPHWPRGGSTQGVQTYITGIGAGETTRTLQANPPAHPPSPKVGHHRKLSSLSNFGPLFFGPQEGIGSGGAHHRSTSSSLSFLNSLDVNVNESADATFLRNLQESTGTPAAAYNSMNFQKKIEPVMKQTSSVPLSAPSKLMPGGTSKRVRRKCTVVGCENRVVQGGLCIAHGAKRKLCKHPGCKKHVKKAGLCSTHGPSRKRCEVENCTKVAVQGGRCIAHGAKKKLCSVEKCTKQAILSGMCKKHHDQKSAGEDPLVCTIIPKNHSSKPSKRPGHTRGLSIFQEISPDAVGDLLKPESGKQNEVKEVSASNSSSSIKNPPTNTRHRSTISRESNCLFNYLHSMSAYIINVFYFPCDSKEVLVDMV